MMELEEAFETWWAGDDDDEPITDISKERAFEIYRAGFRAGGHKPWTSINATQMQVLMKLMKEKANEATDTTQETQGR